MRQPSAAWGVSDPFSFNTFAQSVDEVLCCLVLLHRTVLPSNMTSHPIFKCMVPLPLNSSISFPPVSSGQAWTPGRCLYSPGTGLRAETQPNLSLWFSRLPMHLFLWWRTIWVSGSLHRNWVAHTVIESTMYKTIFTSLDISLRAARVQELTSETVSLYLSASIFHTISSWHAYSQSPPDDLKASLRAINWRITWPQSSFLWWRNDGNFY